METFFTDDMITTILSNINKFMNLIEQLPEEVCTNYKYTHLQEEVTKEELLAFLVSQVQGVCLDKIF